ncbi:MAG: hypothetical protein IJQ08_01550 [Synergistaceae bacterium]|nr:hypothetical protein [Synergistaceae bacterium]
MSVKYVKGNSPLGSLGSIANIAGMATGQPWLSALGMGMNAYNSFSNGTYKTPGFQNTNSNPLNIFGGLFSGNIASNPDNITQRGK